MSLPPSDIEPGDLWAQITAMPRPHRVVPFPRRKPDGQPVADVAMLVLSQEEGMAARASAQRHVRKILREGNGAELGDADLLEMRSSMELLFRACRRADDLSKPFFPTVEAAGKLSTDEIGVMVLNYRRVQMELGPIASDMSQDEVDAWIERLAKGGAMFPFDSLSLGAQSVLITSMACRLWSCMTDSSSPGSPQDAST